MDSNQNNFGPLLSRLDRFFSSHGELLVFCAFMLLTVCPSLSWAQQGGDIFGTNCSNIKTLLSGNFGAMLTAITGALAIIASVAGSFRGAWALLFVSVGSFVFEGLVELLFPGMCA